MQLLLLALFLTPIQDSYHIKIETIYRTHKYVTEITEDEIEMVKEDWRTRDTLRNHATLAQDDRDDLFSLISNEEFINIDEGQYQCNAKAAHNNMANVKISVDFETDDDWILKEFTLFCGVDNTTPTPIRDVFYTVKSLENKYFK